MITATALRKDLERYLDNVVEDGERIIVERNVEEGDGRGVMTVPLGETAADEMDATEWLLSSPERAARLRESIAQARRGEVVTVTMEQLEAMARDAPEGDDMRAAA